ncbi:MAG: membrane dipeptidase [Pseudomonadota bacterium]|nr:membrane dipeptidase [Pseudomonadota bacterium]
MLALLAAVSSHALSGAALAADMQADLHLDTPTQLFRRKVGLDADGLEAGLPQLRGGGTNLAVMVLWPPREAKWEAHVESLLSILEKEDARLDAVTLARSPEEARAIAARGGVAMIYALEGAHGIDTTGLVGLRALQARGLALLGLTWSFSNRYAGSSGDAGAGLTEDGRALVAEAQRLGVVIDLSHASATTTLEVCRGSSAPVIASHSDAAGVKAHARNLTDEEIACIAATGGVVGLNLHSTFLGTPAGVRKAADHVEHLRAVGGIGVVALGSDFDGLITPPPDIATAGALGGLWDELRRRGWTEPELQGMRGENFLRAWWVARSLANQP